MDEMTSLRYVLLMVVAIGLSIRPVLGRAESEFHRSIEILDSEQPSQADAVDAVEQEGQRTKRSSSVKVELRRAALFPLSMMEPETEPDNKASVPSQEARTSATLWLRRFPTRLNRRQRDTSVAVEDTVESRQLIPIAPFKFFNNLFGWWSGSTARPSPAEVFITESSSPDSSPTFSEPTTPNMSFVFPTSVVSSDDFVAALPVQQLADGSPIEAASPSATPTRPTNFASSASSVSYGSGSTFAVASSSSASNGVASHGSGSYGSGVYGTGWYGSSQLPVSAWQKPAGLGVPTLRPSPIYKPQFSPGFYQWQYLYPASYNSPNRRPLYKR